MSQSPEEIRADIERTRSELGSDVDALAEKVNPAKIVQRRKDKVMGRVRRMTNTVMGGAEDLGGRIGDTVHSASDNVSGAGSDLGSGVSSAVHSAGHTLSEAPHRAAMQARGNPLAAGLVAFGVGLLAASLIPASEKEKEAAAALKEKAEPLTSSLTDAAKQVAEDMKAPLQEAVETVKESAAESVQTVKEEGTTAAAEVKERAQDAGSTIQENRAGPGAL